MAKFVAMPKELVIVGGGRFRGDPRRFIIETAPYIDALNEGEAGIIELDKGEKPEKVKALLHRAAHAQGVKVRSSWMDESKTRLAWKKSDRQAA